MALLIRRLQIGDWGQRINRFARPYRLWGQDRGEHTYRGECLHPAPLKDREECLHRPRRHPYERPLPAEQETHRSRRRGCRGDWGWCDDRGGGEDREGERGRDGCRRNEGRTPRE